MGGSGSGREEEASEGWAAQKAIADEALGPVTTEQQRAAICEELGVSIQDMMALEERAQAGGALGMQELAELRAESGRAKRVFELRELQALHIHGRPDRMLSVRSGVGDLVNRIFEPLVRFGTWPRKPKKTDLLFLPLLRTLHMQRSLVGQ